MFTRFSATQRPDTAPVVGTLVSLAAHAVVVLVAVGGGPAGTAEVGRAEAGPAFSATATGERVHWVGPSGAGGSDAPGLPSAERRPIAYVVPGHGPLRVVPAGTLVPRASGRATRDGATLPPPLLRADPERLKFFRRDLVKLPKPPEIDLALLVAGAVASAPDLTRLVTRPEDFRHFQPTASDAELLARARVAPPNGLQSVGPVDVLPIALVSNPLPSYPMILAQARVGGHVLVEFTIDSAGGVDLASLQVVRSTNTLFTQAVRAVLPRLHFLPAQLGEHAVGVRVRQPFEFVMR
jgi:TonB family protein